MIRVVGQLQASEGYQLGEPVTVKFIARNEGDEDAYMLVWFTPLEGLYSDCLRVTREGERIPYDGQLIRRGDPLAEDYLLIHSGESVSVDIDLQEAYSLNQPGRYIVALDTYIADIVSVNLGVLTARAEGLNKAVRMVPLEGGEVSFELSIGAAGTPALQTIGARMRALYGGKEVEATEGPQPPLFDGGDSEQRAIVVKAHYDCFVLLMGAIGSLANDAQYVRWFGAFIQDRFNRVRAAFVQARDVLRTVIFTYDLTATGCKQNWYAYTFKGVRRIWICRRFWTAASAGAFSKRSVLVHEHSHTSSGTDDHAYSEKSCLKLALADPGKAIRNAANYEFYSEGL